MSIGQQTERNVSAAGCRQPARRDRTTFAGGRRHRHRQEGSDHGLQQVQDQRPAHRRRWCRRCSIFDLPQLAKVSIAGFGRSAATPSTTSSRGTFRGSLIVPARRHGPACTGMLEPASCRAPLIIARRHAARQRSCSLIRSCSPDRASGAASVVAIGLIQLAVGHRRRRRQRAELHGQSGGNLKDLTDVEQDQGRLRTGRRRRRRSPHPPTGAAMASAPTSGGPDTRPRRSAGPSSRP